MGVKHHPCYLFIVLCLIYIVRSKINHLALYRTNFAGEEFLQLAEVATPMCY
jgi:hypothetical protein